MVTLSDLDDDPHPVLARLRAGAPVCWVPVLGAWLVTGYDLAIEVLRDARTFTVDDPRFSTAKVVGPSMLSLDGPTLGGTWRSRTARTSASAPTWPAWKPGSPSRRCWPGCPGCAWTRSIRAGCVAWCSASRLSCECAGIRKRQRKVAC
jgi:hypothetical protein